ncbi:hypothetical protein NDU88_010467 [Pleurodeles waltl]|uniref:Uncharacterized protein n=1 Tax=Pleurodeles waltl TaxID=8319 RepID=A0AAV7RZD4_PLEWA|nr:hypothetical protein NDU88_010467 [Pleurodeles waltl]
MNPDFRVPEAVNGDDGLLEGEENIEDTTEDAKKVEEKMDAGGKHGEGRAGNSDVPTERTGPVRKDSSKETRSHRHVPGGAWLNKVPRLRPIDSTRIPSAVKSRKCDAFRDTYTNVKERTSLDTRYHGGGLMELVSCEYKDFEEKMIRDQLVEKTNNKKVQESLLSTPNLTLQRALEIATRIESTTSYMEQMSVSEAFLQSQLQRVLTVKCKYKKGRKTDDLEKSDKNEKVEKKPTFKHLEYYRGKMGLDVMLYALMPCERSYCHCQHAMECVDDRVLEVKE